MVRDKYHMISSLTGTQSTEEKSKQNIARDIEIKNNLTIARGERGGDSEERGEGSTGATIKDTRTKSRGRVEEGEGGGFGWGGWRDGEKMQTTVIEQQ